MGDPSLQEFERRVDGGANVNPAPETRLGFDRTEGLRPELPGVVLRLRRAG